MYVEGVHCSQQGINRIEKFLLVDGHNYPRRFNDKKD